MPVTVRGAPLDRARVAVLGLHGRGASADRFAWDLERRLAGRNDVAYVAPQARDNTWYPKGYLAPKPGGSTLVTSDSGQYAMSRSASIETIAAEVSAETGMGEPSGLSR